MQKHSAKAALSLLSGLIGQAALTTQALAQQAAGVASGSTPFQAAAPVASSSSAGGMIWFSAVTLYL